MKKIFVICLLFYICCHSIAQNKYETREQKLKQLKSREDIKVTEVELNILKLEYPNGKVLYKNIADYQYPESSIQQQTYSPTYDSTIIDLRYVDTVLYYHKYHYWQEVPLHNWEFDHIRIGDVNNNGKPELYGTRKFFSTPQEPVTIYELINNAKFQFVYQYDSVLISENIYDIDKDGKEDVQLGMGGIWGVYPSQRFFSKLTDSSLATRLDFSFIPYDSSYQMNDVKLGEYDGDKKTDLLFAAGAGRGSMHIFEYNNATKTFDSIYRYQIVEPGQLEVSGFSVSDFDLDGKKDIVFGTMSGVVHVVENQGSNQYTHVWSGKIASYHAYIHAWTHDVDGNGKPEFWVLGDAYYSGIGTTRITIFETNGDNSYQTVGRIDLVGVFSFYAGTMQAMDIDHDGTEEVAICIDGNFLILKFNGTQNVHTYQLYYIKQNELAAIGENSSYFGATVYDLVHNREVNILISMDHIIQQGGNTKWRRFTQIYRPDSVTSITMGSDYIPASTELLQNYPNPFNSTTNIQFSTANSANVLIRIYDILGKEIKTLLYNFVSSGKHTIKWDGTDESENITPGGIYFIKMVTGSYHKTIKTILLK